MKYYKEQSFVSYHGVTPHGAEHYQLLVIDYNDVINDLIENKPDEATDYQHYRAVASAKARYAMGIREKDYDNPLIIN